MEILIKFVMVRSGWFIAYIEGSQVIISKRYYISMKIGGVLANIADPGEMMYYAAFHLGLHCLTKYPLWVSGLQRVNSVNVILYPFFLQP